MPVLIPCPICRQQITVIRDGYVREHMVGGAPCTFTRTAHSAGSRGPQMTPEQKQAAADERARKRAVHEAQKAAAAAKKKPATVKPKKVGIECPVCGRTVGGKPDRLAAHQKPTTGRWCSGGVEPSEKQRNAGKKKRSVWAVSGGLPGLGKR